MDTFKKAVELFLLVCCNNYEPSNEEKKFLSELEQIDLSWRSVGSSAPFELLANVQTLRLCGTQVDFLDCLGSLKNLQELDLSETPVGSLEGLGKLTSLQTLDLSGTQISSLTGLENLENLKELKLSRTQIGSLQNLRKSTILQELDLSGTRISSLKGLEGLENLQELDLSGTRISSLKELGGLINLKELDLSGTQIDSLEDLGGLDKLQKLDLRRTSVSSLEGIENLKSLRKLYLNEIQVDDLQALGGLTNLQELDLSGVPVGSVGALCGLINLEKLDLSYTQVNSLEGLEKLKNLQTLLLHKTPVVSLEGLGNLINLQTLALGRTEVEDFSALGKLGKLQTLYLNGTHIRDLQVLSGLTELQSLDLRDTSINSLEALGSLVNLKRLCVARTSLDQIPQFLVKKNLPFIIDAELGTRPGVYMKDVELSQQPPSLFAQRRELIEAYYKEEQVPVNEAKVVFLGDGGVGKTYTIYRIENGDAPESTETTPGVNISSLTQKAGPTINFWDFGGQEIMHSMHRCFLTERTCYVVVVSNRWSEVTCQARRWLKNIESFAPNSKVILALNCWEGVSVWNLDKGRLIRDFPNLVDVVEYTATEKEDIQQITRYIRKVVDSMPSVKLKFPKSWYGVMQALRDYDEYCIKGNEYKKLCRDNRIENDAISLWLLEWFNVLGVCFSYHQGTKKDADTVRLYVILKPRWLTNAVYNIINNGKPYAQNPRGHITYKDLRTVLNQPKICVDPKLRYEGDKLDFILAVMRKYLLSFKCGDDREFVPVLCANSTPEGLRPKNYVSRVRCELRYDYLPDSVVHRLMVKCFKQLDYEKCWLKGLCVRDCVCGVVDKNLFAVCDMGGDDDILHIDVYKTDSEKSSKPQTLLCLVLDWLEEVNSDLGLKSTTWLCSDDKRKAAFQLTSLLKALENGVTTVPYIEDGGFTQYNVLEILGQIFEEPAKFFSPASREGSKEKTISLLVDELGDEHPFFKPVGEKLVKNSPKENVYNNDYVDTLPMPSSLRD